MTCAKAAVGCTIHINGRVVTGTNHCDNPQLVCPRTPGEGYEKCKSICQQRGHAEEVALMKAAEHGIDLTGATAVLYGHKYYCRTCQEKLFDAGVVSLRREPKTGQEIQA